MSDTHKTDKARIARDLARQIVEAAHGRHPERVNQVVAQYKGLETNGQRFGNIRRMKAKEKVDERRAERKVLKSRMRSLAP